MPRHLVPERPFILTGPDRGAELNRPPRRAVPMRRLALALGTLALTALLTAASVLLTSLTFAIVRETKDVAAWFTWLDPWMATAFILPAALYAWRWGRIETTWHYSGYHLGEEEIHIRSGLLTREMITIAYARIQTVEVFSGPVQRRYNLASLSIRTGSRVSTHVEDLDPAIAADLRDKLTELARLRRLPV